MKTMVYHVPFPLAEKPSRASQLRPVMMRKAFAELGYRVVEISGYGRQRRSRIKELIKRMDQGLVVDFVYSEAATIPNAFTEPRHFPLRFLLDRDFFKQMHRRGVPVGVFYRDVYWSFDSYVASVGKAVSAVMKRLYHWDLDTYRRYIDVLFLPSLPMGDYIPGVEGITQVALPPGASGAEIPDSESTDRSEKLRLLYVGAVGSQEYAMRLLFEGVASNPLVELTIVTRAEEWKEALPHLQHYLTGNIRVVHASGDELIPLYAESDIGMLYMEPKEYRDFAVPFKLYEYLGYGLPVIASKGTMAGAIVAEHDCGWEIPYALDSFREVLQEVAADREMLNAKQHKARSFGQSQTWVHRAAEVAEVLGAAAATRL